MSIEYPSKHSTRILSLPIQRRRVKSPLMLSQGSIAAEMKRIIAARAKAYQSK